MNIYFDPSNMRMYLHGELWSGGAEVWADIESYDLEEEAIEYLEDWFAETEYVNLTDVNDFFWFEFQGLVAEDERFKQLVEIWND